MWGPVVIRKRAIHLPYLVATGIRITRS
jgi:hypothetical protein